MADDDQQRREAELAAEAAAAEARRGKHIARIIIIAFIAAHLAAVLGWVWGLWDWRPAGSATIAFAALVMAVWVWEQLDG